MKTSALATCLLPLLLAGCGNDATPVVGPFYLMSIERPQDTALFRCPDGPDGHIGCAGDGLPDATVYAAGGDRSYVVVARHPRIDEVTDMRTTEYFTFARIARERSGWGRSPEKIIGPLTQAQFDDAKQRLNLPGFSVRVGELE